MNLHRELTGWLFSVYPDEADGAVVWLLGEDHERYRFTQPFKTSFYIAGDQNQLKAIRNDLRKLKSPPRTTFTTRRELYQGILPVLMIQADNPVTQEQLFYRMQKTYSRVQYYDAKIPFSIRYGAARKVFPMARCRVVVNTSNQIQEIEALDSPWDIICDFPPLRVLGIEPDVDPQHAQPARLEISYDDKQIALSLADGRKLLDELQNILDDYEPDVIFARWGDGWLFPKLFDLAQKHGGRFNPGRDQKQSARTIKETTFESYGSIYFRDQQTRLFGRWHIDPKNSTMDMGFKFSMRSAIEMARVTSVGVQTAARNSPGSGWTAMQIREALNRGVLVPIHKRQTERMKSAMELNNADGGGLNYRPIAGVHSHVAEIDFFSMYPSIMMTWNISGETVGVKGEKTRYVPDSGMPIRQDIDGLVSSVLKPLLQKRLAIKKILQGLDDEDPQKDIFQSMADALKWLGYVSFGYQGYKNNLYGNIQAHEAICAIGRETLVTGIETAHEMGFKVLAANVDSLFVQKEGAIHPEDFRPLREEIFHRTGLIIELKGIFDWLIFARSKTNPRIGAANRYFGRLNHGGLKVRGLAQRRSDTPPWIAAVEIEIIKLLAGERNADRLADRVPEIIAHTQAAIADLNAEKVPVEDLVYQTRLTREVQDYRGNSTSAKAARQLAAEGKQVRVGQRVKFIYTHGDKSSVFAWDHPIEPDYALINKQRYKELLLRAIHQVIQPLGMEEEDFGNLVLDQVRQLEIPDI